MAMASEVTAMAVDTTVEDLKQRILNNLRYGLARDSNTASRRDWWTAVAKTANEFIIDRMLATQDAHAQASARRVYYLSLEFLMGRMLTNNLDNIGIMEKTEQALSELGQDIEDLRSEEYDMGLGNGGLGRLAACFLDSMATHGYPGIGYGIHYEFGLFKQSFHKGFQQEQPDEWLIYGDAWEIMRPEYCQQVHIYGRVESVFDDRGNYRPQWVDTKTILGIPFDIPIAGYAGKTVNFLRLWESRSDNEFDFGAFNAGGYDKALEDKNFGETISKVLYPNDATENGKELRLVQQYFFVTCSLRDMIRRYRREHGNGWDRFSEKVAIQLNDTHPAVAVAELMRILHDEEGLSWDESWAIVTNTFAYTNHTLLPEALERWSVPLFEKVLPRHAQIIMEINKRFLMQVEEKWPGCNEKKRALSLVEEGHVQMFRMAHLAVVGSHAVNGVAALHTRLLKESLFHDFDELYPNKIQNKTNGVTPRRWLHACNLPLSKFITDKIGDGWVTDLDRLRELEPHIENEDFLNQFMEIKRHNKVELARAIKDLTDVEVSPDAMFDVQIKRLHEYKRQHLNLLHIVTLYRRLLQNPDLDISPRVFIFGAKAAPGYIVAKCIIKAINAVAEMINNDERIQGKLKVVFLPNYRVSLAARIIPATDLSEQISTAGKEASGTGNMKLALNGAVTIGTLDGANVEIGEEVGDDNIFIFGLTVEEVKELRAKGYNPYDYYNRDEELKAAVEWLGSRHFIPEDPHDVLQPLLHSMLDGGDPFLALADYRSYIDTQDKVGEAYKDKMRWARMAALNTARVGKFSSDRTIHQYAEEIWKLPSIDVPMG